MVNLIFRYAFVEFKTNEGKEKAKSLNDSLFKGRQIKVVEKRKNQHQFFGQKGNWLIICLVKNFNNQPVYLNYPSRGHGHSYYGPIKGRYMPSRNFNPYWKNIL